MAGTLSLPGLSLPGLSSLPVGGGGPSGASGYGSITTPITNPFNFDNSNWQVNVKGSGSQSATSASGSTPASGLNIPLLALLVGGWLLLK